MKGILILSLVAMISCNQGTKNEKTITIYDWSKFGSPPPQSDSLFQQRTKGNHYEGEVLIDRYQEETHFLFPADTSQKIDMNSTKDTQQVTASGEKTETVSTYEIHTYKTQEGLLCGFANEVAGDKPFDKATVNWNNDSTVSITMFNSSTHEKGNIKMVLRPRGYMATLSQDSIFNMKFPKRPAESN